MENWNKNGKIGEILTKVKQLKHIKLIFILLLVAIILLIIGNIISKKNVGLFDLLSQEDKTTKSETTSIVSNLSEESRLSAILSKINGVGETEVLITYDDTAIKGVIVVAQGANKPIVEWKIRHAVQTAMQIDYKKVEVYSMN